MHLLELGQQWSLCGGDLPWGDSKFEVPRLDWTREDSRQVKPGVCDTFDTFHFFLQRVTSQKLYARSLTTANNNASFALKSKM